MDKFLTLKLVIVLLVLLTLQLVVRLVQQIQIIIKPAINANVQQLKL